MFVSSALKTGLRLQTGMLRVFMRSDADEHIHSGERLSMLNADVEAADRLYSDSLAQLLFLLQPMIFLTPVIFVMDWRIGIYTIALGVISTLGQVAFAKPIARIAKKTLETTAEATKTIGDIFSGGIIARVFKLEERMLKVFGRDNEILRKLIYREAKIDSARRLVSGIMDVLTTGGVFVVGSILISNGEMTLITLMAIVPLCAMTANAISRLGAAWAEMQGPFEAGRRIYNLLDGNNKVDPLPTAQTSIGSAISHTPNNSTQPTVGATALGRSPNDAQMTALGRPPNNAQPPKGHTVNVKNLTFTYKNEEAPVLKNVNFKVGESKLAAFIGESGSGKSTLLKVVAGLYKSDSAEITIDGKILSHDDIASWRSNFAYVDQNATLFNLTIAENIGLGREGATFDEIETAAIEANAHEFILELPQGYDTPVGEVGGSLSGGQRQRIAIARALIRRAPILVLDEATSALDPTSEREIIETINNLRANHTILLITHNLPAVNPDVTYRIGDSNVVAV